MRVESSVTSISWIPSEAVTGFNKFAFGSGFTHFDDPPPDVLEDVEALARADGFRFANVLSAGIEVDRTGRIVAAEHTGGGLMGSTTVALGPQRATFAATAFDDLRPPPVVGDGEATFVQTVGGHTALPAPRRVQHAPFVQFTAPTVWTTLALTLRVDGSSSFEVRGASRFPRHWIYDADGRLAAKAGLADFRYWWRHSFGRHTPWGDEESEAFVTEVESALERELATRVMRGGRRPRVRRLRAGRLLAEQGEAGEDVYLLLNGILEVEVDGEVVAEVGPGAILGERALLEDGRRTSTLRARTPVTVATIRADDLDPAALAEVSTGHRREESP